MIATTSTDEKAATLRRLGADHVVNYRSTPSWPDHVRELTSGRGVDHVIEVTGQLEPSVKTLATGGEIAFAGLLDRDAGLPPIDPSVLWTRTLTLRAIAVGTRAQFEAMNRAVEINELKPVIDRVFNFDEAVDAFRYYEQARPLGEVVIAHA